MSITTEGVFQVDDDSFCSKTWTVRFPSSIPGAIELTQADLPTALVHGFSDHINCYNELFSRLTARGIQVLAWDQRGWGRSVTKPSEKGLTGGTSRVLADVAAFIKDKLPSEMPVFVMGHSAGGGIILTLAAEPQYENLVSQIRGWILEAPLVGFLPKQKPNSYHSDPYPVSMRYVRLHPCYMVSAQLGCITLGDCWTGLLDAGPLIYIKSIRSA